MDKKVGLWLDHNKAVIVSISNGAEEENHHFRPGTSCPSF